MAKDMFGKVVRSNRVKVGELPTQYAFSYELSAEKDGRERLYVCHVRALSRFEARMELEKHLTACGLRLIKIERTFEHGKDRSWMYGAKKLKTEVLRLFRLDETSGITCTANRDFWERVFKRGGKPV